MPMRLFAGGTTRAVPPVIFLEEVGATYDLVRCDISGRSRPSELVGVNSLGRIPVLVDGDRVLDQSAAIMIYLAEKFGRFLPAQEPARSETIRFLLHSATDIMPGHVAIFRLIRRSDDPYEVLLADHRARLIFDLKFLDRRLAGCDYLAGEISIADFALFPIVRQYSRETLETNALSALVDWIERIRTRPGVVSAESKNPYDYDVSATLGEPVLTGA